MKRAKLLFALFFFNLFNVYSQKIQSPDEFLGYQLGTQFTPHYRVVEYFKYVASIARNTKLQDYGKTNENRQLLVAFIGSHENINRLEEIRKNNLCLSGMEAGSVTGDQPVVVWLSYNVHGNEAASTEAAMKTLYALIEPGNGQIQEWLANTIVAIDPCLNPDGRERYVNFYNSVRNANPDPYPNAREHVEPWPGGRSNHYYFDLNRDWAWQTQTETQQRLALYNDWLPEIHVDFHEQGINEPYYFAPAAEPLHENVTRWQREFQKVIGKNNAKYFDQNGWMYFTKERFDLLYPSYGDTYPIYNGSIGMTYEQGGSGRAGLAVVTGSEDTLTLKNRIDHHYTTGLSTIEAVSKNSTRIIEEYKNYFVSSKSKPPGRFKTYVIKNENPEKLKTLAILLERNKISFGYGSDHNKSRGFNYFTGKTEGFSIDPDDMVITAFQPKSVLLKVLLEPVTQVTDSNTYDITAWSLAYAYGLKAYATPEVLKPASSSPTDVSAVSSAGSNPIGFVANWNSIADVKFLTELLKRNIKVRYTETAFEIEGRSFNPGSLIIARNGNESLSKDFSETINSLATKSGIKLQTVGSGFVDKGYDLGSDKIRFIKKPVIAVITGESTSSLSFGELWHFFEQQIRYPISVLRAQDIDRIHLSKFDIIIFPDGSYDDLNYEKLQNWIMAGGKAIMMEGAIAQFANKKGFNLTTKDSTDKSKKEEKNKDPYSNLKLYEKREREALKTTIPGAIYKVNLDNTHPLAFGFPNFYYTIKLDDSLYQYLEAGWNVGVFRKNNYVTGFAGAEAKKKLVDGLIFGVEELGRGSVVYLTDDPLFRGFWENGKLLFSNAVFMVGQ